MDRFYLLLLNDIGVENMLFPNLIPSGTKLRWMVECVDDTEKRSAKKCSDVMPGKRLLVPQYINARRTQYRGMESEIKLVSRNRRLGR